MSCNKKSIDVKLLVLLGYLLCSSVSSTLNAQSEYSRKSLRGSLIELPHFKTELGRESHRYEDHFNNEFRLYDFYKRQAEYHLNSGSVIPSLLLPYPGLDGGRRGHWGSGNERGSVAYKRTISPDFTKVTDRGNSQHVLFESNGVQSIMQYDINQPGMKQFVPIGELTPNIHPFALDVDRFGLSINESGSITLVAAKNEWESKKQNKGNKYYKGYYLHNDNVIYNTHIYGADVLEKADVLDLIGEKVLSRTIQFTSEGNNLAFNFPVPAEEIKDKQVEVISDIDGNSMYVKYRWGNKVMLHYVTFSGNMMTNVTFNNEKERAASCLDISKINENQGMVVNSWIGQSEKADALLKALQLQSKEPINLEKFTHGGNKRFKDVFTGEGKLNADPAASGTAYEIDDIPIPFDNSYNLPMTISGIGFTSNGVAYVSTLVGDIWKVTGLDETLKNVKWKRFASGLNLPLGVEIVDDIPYISTNNQFVVLHDLNGDDEADFYESFTSIPLPGKGQARKEIQQDAKGNFYYSMSSGIYKVYPDGNKVEKIGRLSRNPFGLGVRSDGLVITDSSEGNNYNGTCTLYEADHESNIDSEAKWKRIMYLPRGFDNSPGSRRFLNDQRFGPLGESLVGVSYGTGNYYTILRDANNGTPQAAVMRLPGNFSCGTARLSANPKDGQLYVAGLDGWGDYSAAEGCINRIRYTGKPIVVPTSWGAYKNGIEISFNTPIAKESVDINKFFVQQWNYVDSKNTYGSPEYSVKNPDQIGHDYIGVKNIHWLENGNTIFIELPGLLPAMCTQIFGNIAGSNGGQLNLNMFATINKLKGNHSIASPRNDSKPMILEVPEKTQNGATYQKITNFFDEKAGRKTEDRPIGPDAIPYKDEDLNYTWIYKNLLEKQCIACHGNTSQHDFSTYSGLMEKIKDAEPYKTHLYGMINSNSMPPYPMPTVSESMQKALFEWIKNGAKE